MNRVGIDAKRVEIASKLLEIVSKRMYYFWCYTSVLLWHRNALQTIFERFNFGGIIMYKKGKWTYNRNENGRLVITQHNINHSQGAETSFPLCEIFKYPFDEDIANNITKRFNSFDGLLEACKSAEKYIFKGGNSSILGKELNSAIAEAENNN